ncbi:MAG: hypothetical protein Q7K45_03780, partial [Nanoarchaeota archaeon]|nr:hypothetical protein [Nanoarchaeota archaeon]
FHPPEREDEFDAVTTVTNGLCRERYITRENADTIVRLLSPRQEVQAFPILSSPARRKTPPPISKQIVTRSRSTKEERLEYLTVLFNLDVEPATHIADNATLEQLEEMQSEMKNMLGENYFLKMVTINPAILLYPAENVFTKYHRTLSLVVGRIKRNGDREILEQRFGVESNLERYVSLEKLTQLKQELLATTGEYAPAPMQTEAVFDLEEYKDKLLMKAEMNVPVVRAYTHGKTALFKGEYYIPREYFRKNATGKVPANILDNNWEDVFDEMVRLKAITKKPKDASPLYRLNPHINEIINPYLREYMRVTLYAAQIIAQEEKITPQFQQSQL